MDAPPVIGTLAELHAHIPDLRGAWVTDLDLRTIDIDWPTIDVTDAAFGGCRFADTTEEELRSAGATVLPPIDSVGFTPYRGSLYTNEDLMRGYEPGHPETTLDARIGATCVDDMTALGSLARGIHDACIDGALQRFLGTLGAPIVGVMGSHAVGRDDPNYRQVAELGRLLTRAGFVVATGGGPGLMEAANLGAWLAHGPDDVLAAAIAVLAVAPRYETDARAFLERALEVRARWPDGAVSLGVPTWLYVDEPLNQFSTQIAKYFQNSIREKPHGSHGSRPLRARAAARRRTPEHRRARRLGAPRESGRRRGGRGGGHPGAAAARPGGTTATAPEALTCPRSSCASPLRRQRSNAGSIAFAASSKCRRASTTRCSARLMPRRTRAATWVSGSTHARSSS